MKSDASRMLVRRAPHLRACFLYSFQVPSRAWAYPYAELCRPLGIIPNKYLRGVCARALNLLSCQIIDICTATGTPYLRSVALKAERNLGLSSRIAHALFKDRGALALPPKLAHPANKVIITMARRRLLISSLNFFISISIVLLFFQNYINSDGVAIGQLTFLERLRKSYQQVKVIFKMFLCGMDTVTQNKLIDL